MIPLWAVIAAAVAVIGTGLYVCDTWDDFLNWLDNLLAKISDALKETAKDTGLVILEAIAKWIDVARAVIEVRIYSREAKKKLLETREAEVPIEELPQNIRRKLRRVDDSADISNELDLTV